MSNDKKDKVLKQNKRVPKLPIAIAGFALIGAIVFLLLGRAGNGSSMAFQGGYSVKEGFLYIPLESVSGGEAQYFSYETGGSQVDFFLIQSSDGVVRAAFDACDVCYQAKRGYSQEGDYMVCNNCGQRFASNRINEEKGGCNPSPLKRQVVDNYVVIAEEDVRLGSFYF